MGVWDLICETLAKNTQASLYCFLCIHPLDLSIYRSNLPHTPTRAYTQEEYYSGNASWLGGLSYLRSDPSVEYENRVRRTERANDNTTVMRPWGGLEQLKHLFVVFSFPHYSGFCSTASHSCGFIFYTRSSMVTNRERKRRIERQSERQRGWFTKKERVCPDMLWH